MELDSPGRFRALISKCRLAIFHIAYECMKMAQKSLYITNNTVVHAIVDDTLGFSHNQYYHKYLVFREFVKYGESGKFAASFAPLTRGSAQTLLGARPPGPRLTL